MTIHATPVRDLSIAPNIRPAITPAALETMKASILQEGVLQNLIAVPMANGTGLAVIAGITRLTALQQLIASGALPADTTVPVLVRADIDANGVDALAIALSENLVRTGMDFVDECAAMLALAKGGKSEADIAALFGYKPRTVRERMLIAQVRPEALDLVRAGTRSLDWARALTLADATFQARVLDDITANPQAWREAEDIRTHLTRATIPTAYALFEASAYTGPIVSDFFEGDRFADAGQFWDLQNEAIEGRVADLEGEGYRVEVLRGEPFADWQYEDAPQGVAGNAFIEVMANGAVRVITGKVPLQAAAHVGADALDVAPPDAGIAPWEVRATGRVVDYANAHKSAILQARLAGDFEAALRYATLAMLGAHNAAFTVQPFAFPGAPGVRTGAAFDAVTAASLEEAAVREAGPEALALVVGMDRPALERLFASLVARRAGLRRAQPDTHPQSAANLLCGGVDVRAYWTPDAAFFGLIPTPDLRRLAAHLVPDIDAPKAALMARQGLIKSLDAAFAGAKDNTLDRAACARLNTWVPGILSFPAHIATGEEEATTALDAESALFGAF